MSNSFLLQILSLFRNDFSPLSFSLSLSTHTHTFLYLLPVAAGLLFEFP